MSNDFPQGTTTSDTSADTADDERSYRAVPDSAGASASRADRRLPVIGGVVAALSAVVGLVLLVRGRRKPPTPQERLAESSKAVAAAAVGLTGRAARRTAAVAEPVARDAATLAAGTAKEAASLTVSTAREAVGLTAESAKKVATVAAEGAREVTDGVESVQRAWGRFVTRLIIIVSGSAGYVLGAQAGRERYDQIVAVARKGWGAAEGTVRR